MLQRIDLVYHVCVGIEIVDVDRNDVHRINRNCLRKWALNHRSCTFSFMSNKMRTGIWAKVIRANYDSLIADTARQANTNRQDDVSEKD